MQRNTKILRRDSTALVIIHIQERILGAIDALKRVIENTLKLIKGFKTLNIPIFYTEQYPKGLGETSKELLEELQGLTAIQKLSFSCFGADNFFQRLKDNNITQVVIAGIESHVCVMQTVLDLLRMA